MDLYMAKNVIFVFLQALVSMVQLEHSETNYLQICSLGYNSFGEKNITIFKHLLDKNGNKISLNRMIDMDILNNLDGNIFKKKKITFQENSPSEILSATKSMITHIENKFSKMESYNDTLVKNFYRKKIEQKYGFTFHKEIHSLICPVFLENNTYLFDL